MSPHHQVYNFVLCAFLVASQLGAAPTIGNQSLFLGPTLAQAAGLGQASTTIVVTSLADTPGGCTLRKALEDVTAQTGSAACGSIANATTISFAVTGVISLTSPLLFVHDVVIQASPGSITLDGPSATRLVWTTPFAKVEIDGLGFNNGRSSDYLAGC